MDAFVINKHSHPKEIPISRNVPIPTADHKAGQVLVEVYAVGLNFFDSLQSQNKYQTQPPLPFTLGQEFSGRIFRDAVIPKGCPFKPGQRVFGASQGAFAHYVSADWRTLVPVPKDLKWEESAGLFVTWPTSYEGLVGRGEIKKGDWVLVHAGAGGVGLPAIQIAKSLGCKVIATASTAEKRSICLNVGGADHTIDYTDSSWPQEVLKLTNKHGVDVVFDPVGLIIPSLKCIAWKGRVVVVGFAGGMIEKVPANLILVKNVSLVGLHWGAYYSKDSDRPAVVWKELLQAFESGKLAAPSVYEKVFGGLEEISQGIVAIESRKTFGKVVARVRSEDGMILKGIEIQHSRL